MARHRGMIRWRTVSRVTRNVFPTPEQFLSFPSPTAGSHRSSHCQVGSICQFHLLPSIHAPFPTPRTIPTALGSCGRGLAGDRTAIVAASEDVEKKSAVGAAPRARPPPGERQADLHGEREGGREGGTADRQGCGGTLVTGEEGGARRRPDPLELGAAELEAAN